MQALKRSAPKSNCWLTVTKVIDQDSFYSPRDTESPSLSLESLMLKHRVYSTCNKIVSRSMLGHVSGKCTLVMAYCALSCPYFQMQCTNPALLPKRTGPLKWVMAGPTWITAAVASASACPASCFVTARRTSAREAASLDLALWEAEPFNTGRRCKLTVTSERFLLHTVLDTMMQPANACSCLNMFLIHADGSGKSPTSYIP